MCDLSVICYIYTLVVYKIAQMFQIETTSEERVKPGEDEAAKAFEDSGGHEQEATNSSVDLQAEKELERSAEARPLYERPGSKQVQLVPNRGVQWVPKKERQRGLAAASKLGDQG